MLYALAASKQDIRSHSIKLGDIKPENIFVNDDGRIKVANIYSWPNETPSYVKAMEQSDFDGLLAPEDFPLLKNNHLDNDANEQS